MAKNKRLNFIRNKVLAAKQELFNRIVKDFGVEVPVKLVRQETVFLGAQGSFEGDKIKINRDLPLFWQLVVLEHEIGHIFALAGRSKKVKIIQRFHSHKLSTEERRAWDFVEENPIIRGGMIDREVKRYIKELQKIGQRYGHVDLVMRLGWWY